METKPRDRPREDPDGVRIVAGNASGRRSRLLFQGIALFLVATCAGYALMPRRTAPPAPAGDRGRTVSPPTSEGAGADPGAASIGTVASPATGAVPPVSTRSATPRRMASQRAERPPEDLTPEQQALVEKMKAEGREEISAGEYIQALNDMGIHEGIGAFNPPGTSPPLEGLAVPEDFPLPEGYVRHYQTTDDGQDIEPILMYSPDYEFLDENGRPIPIPEDRVVPADRVPSGFPVRPIQIPQPKRDSGGVFR